MGTTTKYGWPYPDPSDLVRDAPEAFEDLAAAIETTLTGTVIKVVSMTTTSTTSTTSATYVDTAITASITPRATSSKIAILVSVSYLGITADDRGADLRLYRGATALGSDVMATNYYQGVTQGGISAGIVFLDSPNTASSVTYKVALKRSGSSATVSAQGQQSMLLVEVAG